MLVGMGDGVAVGGIDDGAASVETCVALGNGVSVGTSCGTMV
jgi:hypothetical protein